MVFLVAFCLIKLYIIWTRLYQGFKEAAKFDISEKTFQELCLLENFNYMLVPFRHMKLYIIWTTV